MIKLIGKRIIRNEDEAIRNLEKVYTGIIRSIIWPILKDEQLVEECLNDIWFKLSRHLEKIYDLEENKRKAYICTTAKNAAFDICRRENREVPVGDSEDVREFAVNEGTNLFGVIEKYELSDEVNEALSHLKEIDQEILKKHRIYGFTYKEIAADLGMTESSVSKRGQRAESKLKGRLEKGKQK